MKFGKKLLSVLLTVMMIVSMINVTAFAGEETYVAQIGETKYKTLEAAFGTAAKDATAENPVTIEIIKAGEYEIPAHFEYINLKGNVAEGEVVAILKDQLSYGQSAGSLNNVIFENLTFNLSNNLYTGFQHSSNITFKGCKLDGRLNCYGKTIFENCTFDLTKLNDYIWTYGSDVDFTDCTFNTQGKAILCYNEANGSGANKVSVKGCTFNATQGNKAGAIANQNCAAIEIDNFGCGVNLTLSGNTVDTANGHFSGEWRIKNYDTSNEKDSITVNGVAYTGLALDGVPMTIDASKNVTVLEPVAAISETKYYTLADAVAAAKNGETVTLLKDCKGNGVKIETKDAKNFTIDFNGFTYDVDGTTVGSTGTETQAFHLERGATDNVNVTFKNGKLTSSKAKMLIQNYCNLTLDNMMLDGSKLVDAAPYTLSNNCGNVAIKNSTITAKSGGVAFDVYGGFGNYGDVTVTVTGNSVINGKIEVARSTGTNNNKNTLNINGGTINGDLAVTPNDNTVVTITGGSFSDLASAIKYAADNATIKLAKDVQLDSSINVTKPVTIDGNGKTITMDFSGTNKAFFNASGTNEGITNSLKVSNLKMVMKSGATPAGYAVVAGKGTAAGFAITFDHCTFENMYCGAMLNGCTGTVAPDVTITNSTFNKVSYGVSFALADYAGKVSFENNTMTGEIGVQEVFSKESGYLTAPTVKITSGTFTVDPIACVAEGYTAFMLAQNSFVVGKGFTPEEKETVKVDSKVVDVTTHEIGTVAPEVTATVGPVTTEVVSSDVQKAIERAVSEGGTNEIKQAITAATGNVDVTVATIVNVDTADPEKVSNIESKITAGSSVLKSIDVTVSETVTVQPATGAAVSSTQTVTQTDHYQLIELHFENDDLNGKSSNNLVVYRQHGDSIAAMRKVNQTTGEANPNYECFWIDGNDVVIRANKFSTYSLVLSATPVSVYTPSSGMTTEEYYWQDVINHINTAPKGATVNTKAGSYTEMPASVMNALRAAKGVTLKITWDGGKDITIPAANALNKNVTGYKLADLAKTFGAMVNPETGVGENPPVEETRDPAEETPVTEPETTPAEEAPTTAPEPPADTEAAPQTNKGLLLAIGIAVVAVLAVVVIVLNRKKGE